MNIVTDNGQKWLDIRMKLTEKYLSDADDLLMFVFIPNPKKRSVWDASKQVTLFYKNKNGEVVRSSMSFQNNQKHRIEIPINTIWIGDSLFKQPEIFCPHCGTTEMLCGHNGVGCEKEPNN